MDNTRKKELKAQYKETKPDMGVVLVQSKSGGTAYLIISKNLTGTINRTKFNLNYGNFRNQDLQEEWNALGGEPAFDLRTLETLDYDKDESKTDYSEDLMILAETCTEKFEKAVVIL